MEPEIEFKNDNDDEEVEEDSDDDTVPSLFPLLNDMPTAPEGGT